MLASGQRVRLHAFVESRHYEGILPVVSGRLPGTEQDLFHERIGTLRRRLARACVDAVVRIADRYPEFCDIDISKQSEEDSDEVLVPDCPWHSRFAPAYAKLYARNQITDVPLGESTLHTLRCRAAISAQSEVMRTTPHLLLKPGCNCLFCQKLEEYCQTHTRIK